MSYTTIVTWKYKDPHKEATPNMDIFEKATQEFVIKSGRPVLLVGRHGVGKTSVLRSISSNFNMKMHELNAATLDPFVHIVGIPVVQDGKVTMSPPDELFDAEVLFIDEINRSDRQTRNALFEIICDKSVNGKVLPNLKLVVAAMNPPDEHYQVDELDKAMADRFLYRFKVEANISHALNLVGDEAKEQHIRKWYEALEDPPSPRRLTWAIESTFSEEGINEAALLNALDDKLYATQSLIKMLASGTEGLKTMVEDQLYSEDEKRVLATVIYSALRAGDTRVNTAIPFIKKKFLSADATTFLPAPEGELQPEDRELFAKEGIVKQLNDKLDFGFSLAPVSGQWDENWLADLIQGL